MKKNDLKKVDIHDDYCLWNMLVNATNAVGVLQDYISQHRNYDNGIAYKEYKKVRHALEKYESAIAQMTKKKED